jgi:hypothetical protein
MLTDIDYFAIEYIVMHMRPRDHDEVFGIINHDDPLQFAMDATGYIRNAGRGRVAWHNGRPAGLMAFVELRPGVWEVWAFGTEDFQPVVFELMRWCRKEARDILRHCKGHRLQCYSRADYGEAHKLIAAMGGKREGSVLRRFGKDGADYQTFVWLNGENDDILRPHYRKAS